MSELAPKPKKPRLNPTHRWSEADTKEFVEAVVDEIKGSAEKLEKPTAQRFYTKIKAKVPRLSTLSWVVMKGKMRHLKKSFSTALTWKSQTGAGLTANGDERSVNEYIDKICPHYSLLEQILGQRKNMVPSFLIESSSLLDAESEALHPPNAHEIFDFEEEAHNTDMENSILFECLIPEIENSTLENTSENFNLEAESQASSACGEKLRVSRAPKKKAERNSAINNLVEIQEKKLELEMKKFEWQKEKEKAELEFQNKKMEHDFEIRKLELEIEREKQKLGLEKIINKEN